MVRVGERGKGGTGRCHVMLASLDSELTVSRLPSKCVHFSGTRLAERSHAFEQSTGEQRCFICSPSSHLLFPIDHASLLGEPFPPNFGVYHLTPSSLLESLIPPAQSVASAKPKADGQWSMGEVPTKIGVGSRWKCEEEPNVCPNLEAPVPLCAGLYISLHCQTLMT